jgi:hypothetical protein
MPGGSNYRELLMHLPVDHERDPYGTPYESAHWEQPNVLAHLRLKDRELPEGGTALHMEELQSDWGQDARKSGIAGSGTPHPREARNAFRDELYQAELPEMIRQSVENGMTPEAAERHLAATHARRALAYGNMAMRQGRYDEHNRLENAVDGAGRQVPAGPYIDSTDKWVDLGLKRALLEAAQGGHDKLIWTPGAEQAKRYDMSRHVTSIRAEPSRDKPGHLVVHTYGPGEDARPNEHEEFDEELVHMAAMHPDELEGHFGKEIAQRIMDKVQFPSGVKHQVYNTHSYHPGGSHDTPEEAHAEIQSYPEHMRNQLDVRQRPQGGKAARLEGLDLQTGGEGHKYFYDKLIPKRLLALAREHDPEAALGFHHTDAQNAKPALPGLTITPRMRESILKNGFKAYARGGDVERQARAEGGQVTEKLHIGPIHSPVAGRTDHLPMHVPSGSYVIPADIISAMGEGNTMAGFKHMRRMFSGAPYGGDGDVPYGGSEGPYNEPLKARGGSTQSVPIVAAGGEYVLAPHEVRYAGGGDLDAGHRVLDDFVKRYRARTIKTLSKLPGPKKD